MRILVAVKRVVDYATRIRVKPDKTGIELSNVKMSMNPFCEIAIEEAVRLKEAKSTDEVIAVTVGRRDSIDVLRHALSIGATSAIHVEIPEGGDSSMPAWPGNLQPLEVAKVLAAVAEKEDPGLIFLGKQAVDDDCNQTGQMLAALLGWPQATFASKVEMKDSKVQVTREVDGGLETVELDGPIVITTDLRLNTPRYPSIRGRQMAKKATIKKYSIGDFDIGVSQSRLEVIEVSEPPSKSAGQRVDSVDDLVDKLRNEAKVL